MLNDIVSSFFGRAIDIPHACHTAIYRRQLRATRTIALLPPRQLAIFARFTLFRRSDEMAGCRAQAAFSILRFRRDFHGRLFIYRRLHI